MQEGGVPDAANSMQDFQDWLRQIPGIDEATAISNVINFIEEDKYDVVVFDTAPTGHTLKLLQLPKVGEKLKSDCLFSGVVGVGRPWSDEEFYFPRGRIFHTDIVLVLTQFAAAIVDFSHPIRRLSSS